jgi:hypothetical protein
MSVFSLREAPDFSRVHWFDSVKYSSIFLFCYFLAWGILENKTRGFLCKEYCILLAELQFSDLLLYYCKSALLASLAYLSCK